MIITLNYNEAENVRYLSNSTSMDQLEQEVKILVLISTDTPQSYPIPDSIKPPDSANKHNSTPKD